jgi:vacuolar-type H+-ATPase subunit I/STV1
MNVSPLSNSSIIPITSVISTPVEMSYEDVVKTLVDQSLSQTKQAKQAQDAQVEQFKKDLSTTGAAVYLADENKEKIEAMVEEYRQKLLDQQSKNPNEKMDIAKMVSDYKEQLLKRLEEERKAEQDQKRVSSHSSFALKTQQTTPQIKTQGSLLEQLLHL